MNITCCRVCLSKNNCTRNIFTDKCTNGQSYAKTLMTCSNGIMVVENGALPSHICELCVSELESWVLCGKVDQSFILKFFFCDCILKNTRKKVVMESDKLRPHDHLEINADEMKDIKMEDVPCDEIDDDSMQNYIPSEHESTSASMKAELESNEFSPNCDVKMNTNEMIVGVKTNTAEVVDIKMAETDLPGEINNSITKFISSSCKLMSINVKAELELDEVLPTQCSETITDVVDKTVNIQFDEIQLKTELDDEYFRTNFEENVTDPLESDVTHTYSNEKPFECSHCEEVFCSKRSLAKHLLIHIKKPYNCDWSNTTFAWKDTMMLHERIHTGVKSYKCGRCEKKFISSNAMKLHLRTHIAEKYTCDFCEKSFSSCNSLKFHRLIHTGEKPYKCTICNKLFRFKISLTNHLLTHVSHREKLHKCEHCEKVFHWKRSLKDHLRLHTGKKLYKCDFCDNVYNHSASLRQHLVKHTGEKPYSCEWCKKKFPYKSLMNSHLRTHTGERPYKCNLCDKSFSRSDSMKLHHRSHNMGLHQKSNTNTTLTDTHL